MNETKSRYIEEVSLSKELEKAINLCYFCELDIVINDSFSNDENKSLCCSHAKYILSFRFEKHSMTHRISNWEQKEIVKYINQQHELYFLAKNILDKE